MKASRAFDPDDVSTIPLVHLVSAGRALYDGQVNPAWSAMVQSTEVADPAIPVVLKYMHSQVKVAIELGCSLAATALKLPVPRGMLVLANPADISGLPPDARRLGDREEILCYASVLQWPERARPRTGIPEVDERVWKAFCETATAPKTAAWDELVANGDRHAGNFIFNGSSYWLIDHDNALKPFATMLARMHETNVRRGLIDYRASQNQVASQLVSRRPDDHGILDQPKAFASRKRTLDGLVQLMSQWKTGVPEVDTTFSDAETIVRGIILRLDPLELHLRARVDEPPASLSWTTRPLFTD